MILADSLNVVDLLEADTVVFTRDALDRAAGGVRMTANSLHDVLLRPVISEKSTLETERNNYTFAVARDANKFLIKAAVEAEFKVTVLGVRVVSVRPKQKRRGRKTMGTVPGWKKAIVTIAPGDKIELFEAV